MDEHLKLEDNMPVVKGGPSRNGSKCSVDAASTSSLRISMELQVWGRCGTAVGVSLPAMAQHSSIVALNTAEGLR